MTTTQQSELLNLIEQYNNTDPKTIQKRIVKAIKTAIENKEFINAQALADAIEIVGIQTIYSWCKKSKKVIKIDFETALKIAEVLGKSIAEFIE